MTLYLDTSIQYLKGVGPHFSGLLRKKGIQTLEDLFHSYPRTYEDRRAARNIASLQEGERVSLRATIGGVRSYSQGRSKNRIHDIKIRDGSGLIHCKFFRIPYRGYFEKFQVGQEVRVIGKVTLYQGRLEFHHPDLQVPRGEDKGEDQLIPLYSETEGLTTTRWRKIMATALKALKAGEIGGFKDKLPSWIREEYQLPDLKKTLLYVHQPPSGSGEDYIRQHSAYHQRLIFEEFFWLELLLASRKLGLQQEEAPAFLKTSSLVPKVQASLAFELTTAQKRALREIGEDLEKHRPMHRLVQGDVGSGKTLVALLSALKAIENGYQVALMVPTETLAQQHFKGAQKLLEPLGLSVGLLKGQLKTKERKEINEKMKWGDYQLVVGTHALIQDSVNFQKLGLVIVDEQHRFGVEQRKKLKAKGTSPHFLLMTATPIPRSLAMTLYGDLDVSLIDEMPRGRLPIVTRMTYQNKRPQVLGFIQDQLDKGRQAYVIFPLVEESEKIDLKNAVDEFEKLKKDLPKARIGLLHGKMKGEEKTAVMEAFGRHDYDLLVSTTVVEVGVDVPNANIIWIEHAERFGLSQLHQLRGRVGRGSHKSYCVLSLGSALSRESYQRIKRMEETSDGFKIAEADLELRGPGEFMGVKQSGLPGFKMAHLGRDLPLLQKARQAAFKVLQMDSHLSRPEHRTLKEELDRKKNLWG